MYKNVLDPFLLIDHCHSGMTAVTHLVWHRRAAFEETTFESPLRTARQKRLRIDAPKI